MLDDRITRLLQLRDRIASCIGCGCLSLEDCPPRNTAVIGTPGGVEGSASAAFRVCALFALARHRHRRRPSHLKHANPFDPSRCQAGWVFHFRNDVAKRKPIC